MSDDHYKHWQDAHFPDDPPPCRPPEPSSASILAVFAGISCLAIVLWLLLR